MCTGLVAGVKDNKAGHWPQWQGQISTSDNCHSREESSVSRTSLGFVQR